MKDVAGTAEISSYIDYYNDREVIRTETNFMDATGRSVAAEISEKYADTGEPTGAGGQSRWTAIEKYESDGLTPNPKWEAMEAEFFLDCVRPFHDRCHVVTQNYKYFFYI